MLHKAQTRCAAACPEPGVSLEHSEYPAGPARGFAAAHTAGRAQGGPQVSFLLLRISNLP